MQTQHGTHVAPVTIRATRTTWAGRVLIGLPALFIAVDGIMKLVQPIQVTEAMVELGYSERLTTGIGILALACVAVLLYRRTSILGGVLLTGFLGAAAASNARIEAGLFPVAFPIIIATLIWAGLYLRDERVRALVSPRA